jgi:hypothetical protein
MRTKGAKNLNEKIEKAVFDAFKANPNGTVKEIYDVVKKKLGTKAPGTTSVQKIVTRLKSFELDRPWSIGACKKWNIPADVIPALIIEQGHSLNIAQNMVDTLPMAIRDWDERTPTEQEKLIKQALDSSVLTVRRAIWFACLFPVVSKLAQEQYPENNKKQEQMISELSELYSLTDQFSELRGSEYPDTSTLDKTILIEKDLSSETIDKVMAITSTLGVMNTKSKRKSKNRKERKQ